MNKEIFESKYWSYFLILEEEFSKIEKIIPIDENNFNTFSIQYMKLLFSICSEIDILFKEFIVFSEWRSFSAKEGNFGIYKDIIRTKISEFEDQIVLFSKNIELHPFSNWKNDTAPSWWISYNSLKHNRTALENHKLASQKNVLDAFAGLYLLEMFFFKSIIDNDNFEGRLRMPVPHSRKYLIKNWIDNIELIDNRYILFIDDDGHLILDGV